MKYANCKRVLKMHKKSYNKKQQYASLNKSDSTRTSLRLMINTKKTVLNASSVAIIIHVGNVLRMAKLVLNVEKETTLRLYASHPRIAH